MGASAPPFFNLKLANEMFTSPGVSLAVILVKLPAALLFCGFINSKLKKNLLAICLPQKSSFSPGYKRMRIYLQPFG
jgi:hypothetical protein